jgi:hypothetical protein
MDLKDREWDGMGWINLPQDNDKWRVAVNMAMDLWVHKVQEFLGCFRNC